MKPSLIFIWLIIGCNDQIAFNSGAVENIQTADLNGALKQSFFPAVFNDASVSFDLQSATFTQNIKLNKKPERSITFLQSNRPAVSEIRTQGYRETMQQAVTLRRDGALDILVVVDTSPTMQEHRVNFGEKLEPLLKSVHNTDWRIAIVTATNPCLKDLLHRSDYDLDKLSISKKFMDAVNLGQSGSTERGIEMAIKGLQGTCGQAWTRPNSTKAVLILTDEENCGSASNEGRNGAQGCNGIAYQYYGPDDFINTIGSSTKVFGILYDRNICPDDGYEVDPLDYYNLISRTNGRWGPICQSDYTTLLEDISKDIQQDIIEQFTLVQSPVPNSLQFFVNGQNIAVTHKVDGNKLTIEKSHQINSVYMDITYLYEPVEMFQNFTMSQEPDETTLEVFFSDQKINPDQYQFDKNNKTINFLTYPPALNKVTVNYRLNEPLTNRFELIEKPVVQAVRVETSPSADKAQFYSADFSIVDQTVVFDKAPVDGAEIRIYYRRPEDFVTQYHIALQENAKIKSIEVKDIAGNIITSATLENDMLHLTPESIANTDEVKGTFYLDQGSINNDVRLPFNPEPDTVSVTNDIGENCPFTLEETNKVGIQCKNGEQSTIHYKYFDRLQTEFHIDRKFHDLKIAKVKVDGREITNYDRQGQIIRILEGNLSKDSTIEVQFVANNK